MVYYYILIIIFRENKILLLQEKENKHNKLLFQGLNKKTNDWVWRNHFFWWKKLRQKKEERKYITEKITHKTQRSIQFSTQCSWCLLHKKIAKLNLKVPSSYFSSSHHHCHSVLKLEKSAFSNVCLCVCVWLYLKG